MVATSRLNVYEAESLRKILKFRTFVRHHRGGADAQRRTAPRRLRRNPCSRRDASTFSFAIHKSNK